MHANAVRTLEKQQKDKRKIAAMAKSVERNAENVQATAVVFCTVYEGAQLHLSSENMSVCLICSQLMDLNAETCSTRCPVILATTALATCQATLATKATTSATDPFV
jgi:hypothetical protein